MYLIMISMAEVERDLEVIFDVLPTSEDLSSKLAAEKVYVYIPLVLLVCIFQMQVLYMYPHTLYIILVYWLQFYWPSF